MSGCTRYSKTTGRRCRREAAEWPQYDDLPAPVAACASHLTREEWAACQEARERSEKERAARWKEEQAAREAHGEAVKPAAGRKPRRRRPCIRECISLELAYGHDSDGGSMSCAKCDGWICVSCGKAEVEGVLEFCASCTEREAMYNDPEPEWDWEYNGEVGSGLNPRARLTA
jgi:hypothetical protein